LRCWRLPVPSGERSAKHVPPNTRRFEEGAQPSSRTTTSPISLFGSSYIRFSLWEDGYQDSMHRPLLSPDSAPPSIAEVKYLRMKVLVVVLWLLQGIAVASLQLDEVNEAKIVYWKWTGKGEVSYWDIPATKEEILGFRDLLSGATQVQADKIAWFITAYKGVITTTRGEYAIMMGDEKIARQTYRISLTPIGEPQERETLHYLLPKEEGRKFQHALELFLANKARRNPDRIEHPR
jgi:hypothetical protein